MPAQPLRREMAELDIFCRARFPEHFGRVALDRAAGRLTVHRLPSAELDEEVRAAFPQLDVGFADAPHSSAELAAVRQTVHDLQSEWSARGVVFNGLRTAPDYSAVIVHVAGDEAAIAGFAAVLGPLPVRLLRNAPVLLTAAFRPY